MAIVFMADGSARLAEPSNGKDFSLEEMQQIVDGHIEIHEIKNNRYMVINEEGKLRNLEYNHTATCLYRQMYGRDVIVGDVLVCNKNQIK